MTLNIEANCCEDCKDNPNSFCDLLCANPEVKKICKIVKKNQIIYHENTIARGVYCISSGKIKVYKTSSDGREQILYIAKAGDLLGYSAMVEEAPHKVSAMALEESKICFILKMYFLPILKKSSELQFRLLQNACRKKGVIVENLANMALKSVRERIAIALLTLNEVYTESETPQLIKLSREDISNIVGAATETTIRILNEFRDEKIIEMVGRKIRVVDEFELIKISRIF